MTGRGQLSRSVHDTLGRLAWGFGELRRMLAEHGAWPAITHLAVALDGGRWAVTGSRMRKAAGARKPTALLVPESECLWGAVQFPAMPRQALEPAVQEALWRVSPLPPEQIAVAWEAAPDADGSWVVHWGMCRRNVLGEQLAQHQLPEDTAVFLIRQERALPVRGKVWQRQAGRQRWIDGTALVMLSILLLALSLPALMPLILKRQAVVRAVQHVDMLVPKAASLRQKVDELRRQAEVANELRKSVNTNMPLASVVDDLSAALPADTWLDRIEVNGSEIRITGLTSNAAELIAQLGRQPGLADVRATAANVRDGSLNKERFAFEMRWRAESAKQP